MDVSDVRYSVLSEKSEYSTWTQENSVGSVGEPPASSSTLSSKNATDTTAANNNNKSTMNPKRTSVKYNRAPADIEFDLSGQKTKEPVSIELALNHNEEDLGDTGGGASTSNVQNVPSLQFKNPLSGEQRGLYQRQKYSQTVLLVLIALLAMIVAILILMLLNTSKKLSRIVDDHASLSNNICLTDRCLLVSGSMYKSMNREVNPCEDFYEYACGGFSKNTLIPAGFPRWGTLNQVTYENSLLIRQQLESNKSDEITEAERKAKVFYRSCIDKQNLIENLGSKPLMNILNRFMYKNPSSNRLEINETFAGLLNIIQIEYGLNSIFEFNVLDDDKNSSFSNIELIQGSLGLERSYYLNASSDKNAKVLDIYNKTMINTLKLLYGPDLPNVNEEVQNVLELETKMANIMLSSEKFTNVEEMYSRMTVVQLNQLFAPHFDWKTFLNSILKAHGSNETLTELDSVIVMGVEYFERLKSLLEEYQSTPEKQHTLKLTCIFHLIKFSLPLLSKEYRNMNNAIGEALTGSATVERWQTCIEHTDNIFGLGYAVTKMFLRVVPNNSKNLALELIKSIKLSFTQNFHKLSWMDKETSLLAEEKVHFVDDLIGYPDFIENDTALNLRYKDIYLSEDDYFGNEIRLIQYALKSEIMTYRTRVNKAEWEMTSSAVNAYYSPTRNQIVFPSGILQEPFFHPEYPMSVNYGSIGSVMGHELTHGFDESGREYDKNGMMHEWWNSQTIENFKNATQCMIEQYSKFDVNGEMLNGRQTLAENTADNGGLSAAYRAYEGWIKAYGEERRLPLLNLTNRQIFFLSFAQTWCSKSTPDSMHLSLTVDQHSPPKYRVIGSISNSEDFAREFNCPINSPMNPANKCKLW